MLFNINLKSPDPRKKITFLTTVQCLHYSTCKFKKKYILGPLSFKMLRVQAPCLGVPPNKLLCVCMHDLCVNRNITTVSTL